MPSTREVARSRGYQQVRKPLSCGVPGVAFGASLVERRGGASSSGTGSLLGLRRQEMFLSLIGHARLCRARAAVRNLAISACRPISGLPGKIELVAC